MKIIKTNQAALTFFETFTTILSGILILTINRHLACYVVIVAKIILSGIMP
jgi:hypothetical protein